MIKTLRITTIIVAVLAVVFFALPAAFGFRGDKQIEQFLNSAGVIEGFKEAKGEKSGDNQHEISPLVKQAEAFALYLNPPPKSTPAPSAPGVKSEPRPAGPVAAKFNLIGTSRHVLQPELSIALIDEPGKGLYWVRQSGKVGHLIIEQIRDGVVVVRDGQNTFELVAERPEKRSLVKASTSPISSNSPSPSSGRITSELPPGAPVLAAQATAKEVQVGAEEKEMTEADIKKMMAELDAMQMSAEEKEKVIAEMRKVVADPNAKEEAASGAAKPDIQVSETDSDAKAKEIEAVRKKSISDAEAMRISAKEARGLGRLGRRLRNVQREPSRVPAGAEPSAAQKDNITESNAAGVSHPQADLSKPNSNEPGSNDVNNPGQE
jgi:hypothetical protein